MARTMKDKKQNMKAQSDNAKKVNCVKKTIKKGSIQNTKKPIKKIINNTQKNKKQVTTSKKQQKKTTSLKSNKDIVTKLTSQVLKKVKKQVQSYQYNVKTSDKRSNKEKQLNDKNYESDSIQQGSRDIEQNSNLSNESNKRKRALQNQFQSLKSSNSPEQYTLNSTNAPKKVKIYKKLTRSGKQYGEVNIKENLDILGKDRVKFPIESSKDKTKKKILIQQNKNKKQKNENQFLETDDATLTIRYRRPNKNLQINDESEAALNHEKNTSKTFGKLNKIISTSFQQYLIVNIATADTSRGCSTSKEDIQSELDYYNNSKFFLIRGNNLPKKTVCAKQVPLIFKKPMTIRESIPQVKTKRPVNAIDAEQNEINKKQNYSTYDIKKQNSNNKYNKSPQIQERQDQSLIKKNVIEQQQNDDVGKQLVDFVFCCDTTSSMGEYLQATIDYIAAIYKKTKPFEQIIDIKYGFVCYRDHPPEESSYLYRISNLNSPLKTIQFIQQQDAEGGGDTPEAVLDGLYVATSGINWRKNSIKYIIHIADAPPHGDLYTGINGGFLSRSFVWRDGCPCGLTIEKIAKIMNSLQIHYRLIKAGDNMERMSSIFKSCIEHYADIKVNSPEGLDFILSDMVAKQCLMNEDIQNEYIDKYSRQQRIRSDSQYSNREDIEEEQENIYVEDISQRDNTFQGINKIYSNNYQAFKNHDKNYEKEIIIEESQQQLKNNFHMQQVNQNKNQNNRINIQKLNVKYTTNQSSKLPINYKQYARMNLPRNDSFNLNNQDEIEE